MSQNVFFYMINYFEKGLKWQNKQKNQFLFILKNDFDQSFVKKPLTKGLGDCYNNKGVLGSTIEFL